jgi:hypothetical protein
MGDPLYFSFCGIIYLPRRVTSFTRQMFDALVRVRDSRKWGFCR